MLVERTINQRWAPFFSEIRREKTRRAGILMAFGLEQRMGLWVIGVA